MVGYVNFVEILLAGDQIVFEDDQLFCVSALLQGPVDVAERDPEEEEEKETGPSDHAKNGV